MVTIHTAQDFIHALREDPDLLDQVRRAIMTDEVLALPKQFAALLQTQNRILAELAESRQSQADIQATQSKILADQEESRQTQAAIEETQNELLADRDETRRTLTAILQTQADMQEKIAGLLETQNRILAEQEESRKTQENMGRDIRALHGMYRQQHEDFGRFRGNYAIDTARDNVYQITRPIMRALGMRGKPRYRRLREADLDSILTANYDAIEALGLGENVWWTFMRPDLIVEVTERRSDEPGFYVALEASYTGDTNDTRRAVEHAMVLRTTGRDAYAVVASVRLGPSIEDRVLHDAFKFVESNNEEAVLWYKLDEEWKLEPSSPC